MQDLKKFDFQFPDNNDEEMTLLIDVLIDSGDVLPQHQFEGGENRRNFHVTLKPNVKLQRPLHLNEKLEKFLTQLEDAVIIGKTGDTNEMRLFF